MPFTSCSNNHKINVSFSWLDNNWRLGSYWWSYLLTLYVGQEYDCTLSVSTNCVEYGYNPPNTNLVSFQTLDQNNVIQIGVNNQGFNAEQIIRIYIYIQRVKPFEDEIWRTSQHRKTFREWNTSPDISPLSLKTYTWLLLSKLTTRTLHLTQ